MAGPEASIIDIEIIPLTGLIYLISIFFFSFPPNPIGKRRSKGLHTSNVNRKTRLKEHRRRADVISFCVIVTVVVDVITKRVDLLRTLTGEYGRTRIGKI